MSAVYCLDTYRSLREGKTICDKPRSFTEVHKKQIKKDMQKGYMKMLANFNQSSSL